MAALIVVVWHSGATRLIPGGYLAVDLFFVLSGFVLAYAFSDRRGWLSFMGARLKRLYPLYIAGAALGASAVLLWIRADVRYFLTVATGIFMLPAPVTWGAYHPYPFDSPAWSLLFELLVNAAWFALVPRLSNRLLATIIILSGVALAAVIFTYSGVQVGDTGPWFLPLGFIRACFSFFVGVACYRMWNARPARWRPQAWVLAAVFLLPVMAPLPRVAVDAVAVFTIFPVLIYLGAGTALSGRLAATCDATGRASYAVYTLHAPLLAVGALAL